MNLLSPSPYFPLSFSILILILSSLSEPSLEGKFHQKDFIIQSPYPLKSWTKLLRKTIVFRECKRLVRALRNHALLSVPCPYSLLVRVPSKQQTLADSNQHWIGRGVVFSQKLCPRLYLYPRYQFVCRP